ncbi:hypothetical protein [Salipiger abyssi]|uniref:hypothetical protein n=1 Tax=Salipiger abyssi TaxID=1250539 RepID=UPI004057E37F
MKTRKTAGTSIEVDLSQRVEEEAIVTPILPEVAGHRARNYQDPEAEQGFRNHMPASEIRSRIGAERFDGMFCFCVEREPIEKCISHFHMLRNSPLHNQDGNYRKSWEEYLATGSFPNDVSRLSEERDGKRVLIVDRVLRYDRLHVELPELMAELGVPDFQLKARAKSEYSQNRLLSREDVTPEQRALIYEVFRPTLELTGIDWDRVPERT